MGSRLGDADDPLLVSVRSGAAASMPGMMDTILNLGLNGRTVEGLARQSEDPRFAFDSYRRFVQMYANVVLGIPLDDFEERLEACKRASGVRDDTGLGEKELRSLVAKYRALVKSRTGRAFPDDPEAQLFGAIGAVFDSWNTPRAVT